MLKFRHLANSASAIRTCSSVTGRISGAFALFLLIWIVALLIKVVAVIGELLGLPYAAMPPSNSAQPETIAAASVTIAVCIVTTVLARVIKPNLAWMALFATSCLIILTTATTTGSLRALGVALFISAIAWFAGELLLTILPGSPINRLVRVPLASGVGLGLIGFVWLVLAVLGRLDALSVVISTGFVLVGLLFTSRRSTGRWRMSVGTGNPIPPGWYETVLVSFTGGLVTFALLTAFVPEIAGDATRQHLPIAREFWQANGAIVLDGLPVTRQAIENHVVLAVAYGAGGVAASQLLQAAIGIASIFSVAALGWLCHGRVAALVALCVFGTLPVVLWELGHAFIDLMPVLFTTCALACVLIWQKEDRSVWLVLAGAVIGVGVAAKLNMIAVLIAIPIALLVVGRASWNSRQRLFACAAFCLGATTLLPWLIYNTYAAGSSALLEPILSRLPGSVPRISAPLPDAVVSANEAAGDSEFAGPSALWVPFGHEIIDLLRVPWLLTFHGDKFAFPIIGRGEIGVAPILLVPFSFFGIRRRPILLLLIVAAITYVAWWLSPYQIARHLLPVLAITAALGGSGIASLIESKRAAPVRRGYTSAALAALMASIFVTSLFFVASFRAQLPFAFLIGSESHDSFVRRTVRAAEPLLASNELLPPETPVAYLGVETGGAQLYTEARLVFFPNNDAGTTAQQVLDTLAKDHISHIIWQRGETSARDSSSTIRSTPFLRQYTRILAGENNAYLFEVLPEGNTTWGEEHGTNLLQDPGLQDVKNKQSSWTVDGKRVIAKGVIALARSGTLKQAVPATPGKAYLLETPVRCLHTSGRSVLTLRWLDANGNAIASTAEKTMPGREMSEQFVWQRAPEQAAQVEVEFSMDGPERCEYSGAALYELP